MTLNMIALSRFVKLMALLNQTRSLAELLYAEKNLMRGSKEIARGGSHNVFLFFYDTDFQRDAIGHPMGPIASLCGSIPRFRRKPIATCEFQGSPYPLPPSGSTQEPSIRIV